MRIYNSLTDKVEEFKPINEGKVTMYVCGPTVYNYVHIGNMRPVITFDMVYKYLKYLGYDVKYASNYTDINPKITKAAETLGMTEREVADKFIKAYEEDLKNYNCSNIDYRPRVINYLDDIFNFISKLIEKGYAYEKNGTVYFRTRKFKNYGQLSKKNLDDMRAGIRIAVSDEKEDAMDFVLWKPKKEGEPAWVSPWGEGRPGWHIECSEMSKKYIGDTIDIHAGGEDLVFPHHENEIAQSEACNDEKFANYWMHNAFLNIDNKKMSKSAGNFFTVREISEKYPLQVIRFFMLSAHYRSPLNFSDTLVEASKNGLERILTAVDHLREVLTAAPEGELTAEDQKHMEEVTALKEKYEAAMEDDFNTADAIAAIFELVKLANITAESGSKAYVQHLFDTIVQLCDILGIITEKKEELLDADIEALIEERQAARKAKNFARADEIRDMLADKGIILEDTRAGVKWKRA